MKPLRPLVAALIFGQPVLADVPKVAVDIAPVHALAAQVMAGVGMPELVVPPKTSPHGYALRPSQARTLQDADLVIWIGPELTPWLAKPLSSLAAGAEHMPMLTSQGTMTHGFREGLEDADMHDEGADHGDDHDNDHGHDDHDDHDDGHDHHGEVDPHAWLNPENAKLWLGQIAETLARMDPDNADRYRANAAAAQSDLDALSAEITGILAPVKDRPFVTFHDAFQYFDARFGLAFVGAVSLGDATDPSPARLAHLREVLKEHNVRCAFSEPQYDDRMLRAAADGVDLQISILDPMGSSLQPGPDLYARLLRDMAQSLAGCR